MASDKTGAAAGQARAKAGTRFFEKFLYLLSQCQFNKVKISSGQPPFQGRGGERSCSLSARASAKLEKAILPEWEKGISTVAKARRKRQWPKAVFTKNHSSATPQPRHAIPPLCAVRFLAYSRRLRKKAPTVPPRGGGLRAFHRAAPRRPLPPRVPRPRSGRPHRRSRLYGRWHRGGWPTR